MGLLDNNNIIALTTPKTGLEGTRFKHYVSTDSFDMWVWERENTQSKVLILTYRDYYAWTDNGNLYLSQGDITDEPITIQINSTNFPNLRRSNNAVDGAYPIIDKVIACPCMFSYPSSSYGNMSNRGGENCRICVIFSNGQIYHNYPSCNDTYDFANYTYAKGTTKISDLFSKFDESVVWDLPERKHPVKTNTGTDATLISTGKYYYNPSLPDRCYEFHPALSQPNGYGNTVGFGSTITVNNALSGSSANIEERGRFWRTNIDDVNANSFSYMGGYVNDCRYTMIGTYRTNTGSYPCRICVFGTQDGGRNWFLMYELGGMTRLKVGSTYKNANGQKGIPLSSNGNSESSGVYQVKRRTSIVPSSDNKEPSTLFEYETALDVSSIVGNDDKITVITASAHGFVNGDCVIFDFASGVTTNNRSFDWIVNSGADAVSGGNGIMFTVTEKTADTFVLSLYPYNPNNNLPVRHIHAINKCKDGISVSCGEDYPYGGWIFYNPIISADAFGTYNVAKSSANAFIRLNSTDLSFCRALGCIIQQEDEDTYAYIGVDSADIEMNEVDMPEGRTESFRHNSCGVWKVPVSGIDNMKDNAVLKLNSSETCFGLQQMDNVMVFIGQFGELALSYDNGVSWTDIRIPVDNWGQNLAHFSGTTYDRRFSVDNILIQLKK